MSDWRREVRHMVSEWRSWPWAPEPKTEVYVVSGTLGERTFAAVVREESRAEARAIVQELHPDALIDSVRVMGEGG